MHTTNELLDLVKSRHALPSDYKLGLVLGLSHNAVGHYRKGRTCLDDRVSIKVAELLDLDAGYVAACMHSERASDDTIKALWSRVAFTLERSTAAALAVILSVVLLTPGESQASASVCSAGEYPLTCAVPLSIHCGY